MSERTIRQGDDGPPGYRRFGTEVQTEPGDEISVEADLAETIVEEQGFFEFVGDDGTAAGSADAGDEPPDGEAPKTKDSVVTAPGEFTIPEIEDELATGEWDDHLETLRENEEAGKDRSGVYDALGVRRAELEE